MIPEIGNPIVDYILKDRKSDTQFVFVSEKGKKLNSPNITDIINTYFSNSNIEINGRHYGAHALRHSVATNLLNNSVPIYTVANVLGHSNTESVHIYAKVDIAHLRKCVLEAPYL
mgnify:CR=1 FL=1